jgi:hypothetical protein
MIAPILVQVCDGGYGKNVMKKGRLNGIFASDPIQPHGPVFKRHFLSNVVLGTRNTY